MHLPFVGQACHNVAVFTALACKLRQQIALFTEGFALQYFICAGVVTSSYRKVFSGSSTLLSNLLLNKNIH